MILSPKTAEVLASLRDNTESEYIPGWRSVYLDNARPEGMSARSFAGHLSALTEAGLYKSMGDGFFGEVKTKD